MSKFSVSEKKAGKLEESLLNNLELSIEDKDLLTEEEAATLGADLFEVVPYDEAEAERIGYSNYSYWGSTVRMFFKNKTAVAMLVIMATLLLFTFLLPVFDADFDPNYCHLNAAGQPIRNQTPNAEFLFGTNAIGQDLWSKIWEGSRNSLFIGFAVATINAVVGIIIGMIWGYVRQLDFILTEMYNVVSNIPSTIILILISYILKPGLNTLIFAMCLRAVSTYGPRQMPATRKPHSRHTNVHEISRGNELQQ